jgi:hypothetical protein
MLADTLRKRWSRSAAAVGPALVVSLLAIADAAAEQDDAAPPVPAARQALEDATTLPFGLAASRTHMRAAVNAIGGYDGARDAGVMEVQAAVRIFGPLSIHGGGIYVSDEDDVRPSLGAMVQLFEQDRSRLGLDAALGLTYRPEGLTEPEGEIEAALAVGRKMGSASLVASATYGQDAEGNERDGELRAAGLVPAGRVLVGADARGRLALTRPSGSTEPDYDVVAGPVLVWPIQSFAVTGLVGASVVGTSDDQTEAGVLGLFGLSRVF